MWNFKKKSVSSIVDIWIVSLEIVYLAWGSIWLYRRRYQISQNWRVGIKHFPFLSKVADQTLSSLINILWEGTTMQEGASQKNETENKKIKRARGKFNETSKIAKQNSINCFNFLFRRNFKEIYQIFLLLMMVSIREKGGQVWKRGDYWRSRNNNFVRNIIWLPLSQIWTNMKRYQRNTGQFSISVKKELFVVIPWTQERK